MRHPHVHEPFGKPRGRTRSAVSLPDRPASASARRGRKLEEKRKSEIISEEADSAFRCWASMSAICENGRSSLMSWSGSRDGSSPVFRVRMMKESDLVFRWGCRNSEVVNGLPWITTEDVLC